MRKLLLLIGFISLSTTIWSQKKSDGLIENLDFFYTDENISIKYDLIGETSKTEYFIWFEAYYAEKSDVLEPKTLSGDIGTIKSGLDKQIIWNIKKDGLLIDESIFFKVYALKLPNKNLSKSLLYSTLLPGLGNKQAGAKNNTVLLGVAGYSAIIGSILFNQSSKDFTQKYLNSFDDVESEAHFNKAEKFANYSFISAGVAAGIWAINYAIVGSRYAKTKKMTKEKLLNSKEAIIISAKSASKTVSTRGVPPGLFADLSFIDANKNDILEAGEQGELIVKIANHGKGDALNLEISVKDSMAVSNIQVSAKQIVNIIKPGETETVKFAITTNTELETGKHKFEILVKEGYGFDMDPMYLQLPTFAFQKPKFAVSGYEIVDFGEGTSAVKQDGQLQLGEMALVRLTIQNIGQGAAEDINFGITAFDPNIFMENNTGKLTKLQSGELQTLVFTIVPNKRVQITDNKLKLNIKITEQTGKSTFNEPFYITLNQKAPEQTIVNVYADINSLQKNIATFVTDSKKFSTKIGDLTDIKTVPQSVTKRPNALGVVIGIGKYENMAPAPYADNDAIIMKDYFKKVLGIENVITLTNQEASISRFKRIFTNAGYGEISKNVITDSTEIFVFYSGHGIPDKTGDNTYLFPNDGVTEDLSEFAYNIETLYNNLNNMGAKNVTIFMDACFSGFSKPTQRISAENLIAQKGIKVKPKNLWRNNPKFTVYASSTAEETSLGFDVSETGLFTYYLCEGLTGKADTNLDKKITSGELRDYVAKKVKETSVKISGLQTPEFIGNENRVLVEY